MLRFTVTTAQESPWQCSFRLIKKLFSDLFSNIFLFCLKINFKRRKKCIFDNFKRRFLFLNIFSFFEFEQLLMDGFCLCSRVGRQKYDLKGNLNEGTNREIFALNHCNLNDQNEMFRSNSPLRFSNLHLFPWSPLDMSSDWKKCVIHTQILFLHFTATIRRICI